MILHIKNSNYIPVIIIKNGIINGCWIQDQQQNQLYTYIYIGQLENKIFKYSLQQYLKIKYKGIDQIIDVKGLQSENYQIMLRETLKDLNKWENIPY